MNLQEIVNRKITEPFSTEEIGYCIQSYIKDTKGINTEVNLERTLSLMPQQFHIMYMNEQLPRILFVFDKVRKYYKPN